MGLHSVGFPSTKFLIRLDCEDSSKPTIVAMEGWGDIALGSDLCSSNSGCIASSVLEGRVACHCSGKDDSWSHNG
uniref:Uncharacterized protein n=1 Tax=Glycine max TaxID=3847 RepID=A0A0R0KPZ5_SOYBN